MSKVIKGRGKISFHDEKDRERMNKKYPEIEFEKMNPLTFTTTYKGNKQFEVEIKVGDTKIPCSIQKWAWPWKYRTKVELRLYFKDLKKKAITHITGGIQHELFRFFRYDYEKMIKDDSKLNKKVSKKTKKKEKPQIIMVEYSKGKAIRKVYNVDKLSSKQKKKTQKGGKQTMKKSKKDKYICYTGIGAKKSGNHTEKEFLKVMNDTKYNFNETPPTGVKTINQWVKYSGAEKGKCKKDIKDEKISKKDKTVRNKYKKISRIDCAKKYPKSRDKTLKCLDQKMKDLKSLEREYPQEMESLKKEIKDYEIAMYTFMKEATDCKKHMPDTNKFKKCTEEVGKKYGGIFKGDKEISQIYTDNMRDKLYRMIDHTQKVDLGELGKLNLK